MQLSQCLRMLSEHTINAIEQEQAARFSLTEVSDLTTRLTDPVFLSFAWAHMSNLERDVIRLFLLQAPQGFIAKKQWDRLAAQEHAHLTHGLTKLRRFGVIYTLRKMWSEIGYIMPQELRQNFLYLLCDQVPDKKTLVNISQRTLPYYIPSGRGIQLDVFALLLFLREFPIQLTKKSAIPQRFLQKLSPIISLKDEHVKGLVETMSMEKESAAVNIVLDLALRLNLVRVEGKWLRLNRTAVKMWMNRSQDERRERLSYLLQQYYLPQEPWCEAFAYKMKQFNGDGWVSVKSMLDSLRRIGFSFGKDAEQRILTRWLLPLLGFGWIQVGEDEQGHILWRWNEINNHHGANRWYVEASGEILIPPTVPLSSIWELSKFGNISFAGDFPRCQLHAEKMKSFFAGGGTDEEIIQLLQQSSAHALPETVVAMVRGWARQTRQIRFERVTRVRTADARLLAELREISAFQPFLTEIISTTDFLISEDQHAALHQLLMQYGYDPQVWTQREVETDGPEETDREGIGVFDLTRAWEGYQVENVFPEQFESLPKLGQLPKMWTQNFQSYHPQTMRDLFKRALELQIEVRVESDAGLELQGIPQKVEVDMGYWYITLEVERKRLRYKLDHIRRVRIVLPDYL